MRIASNALADVRRFYLAELAGLYPVEEAGALFDWAAEEILGESRAVFRAQADRRVSESELLRFFEVAKRLRKGEPVQYVFGRAYFDDMALDVSPAVLIPRPETEQMVSLVSEEGRLMQDRLAGGGRLRVWDACTGSGCIALALYRRLGGRAEVCGSDVSDQALAVARRNAETWGTPAAAPLRFLRHDLLADAPPAGPWHVIVSNPPYVRESEKALMRGNVLCYEPASALFVPDADPLRFYEALGRIARETLADDGVLWAEINEALSDGLTALYRDMGFQTVDILRDFRDKPRFVRARFFA